MKVCYFSDTDTLYIEIDGGAVSETRDLDQDTTLDLDDRGRICGITLEHASQRTDVSRLIVEGMAA
ncbi:DUF2283 domain-containing protein [Pseudohaliea rubra]|uniref:DUF2283 domain-containing protein n=1 Tax=Pseudohaliea rubra DSM 19751 TaxID=1265313 RepID=A0A095VV11_9GAMM|nr:DUF2283 domain-containing protein [Pseudohaliea rubra]KGE05175.1 hypothetical protein HRUBRA_00219 [Pseudohaliea rubra DSM 19751]